MFLCRNKCAVFSIFLVLLIIGTITLAAVYQMLKHKDHARNLTPMVINTWNFQHSTSKAWELLNNNMSAITAVEEGCTVCELEQCKKTVGFGGSPDENGETTLDAMIIDGRNMNSGGVGGLRSIKTAISVARRVLENTKHTLIAGDLATQFALNLGFVPESLQTNYSYDLWKNWTQVRCQPNFWSNVSPDPTQNCGPYEPLSILESNTSADWDTSLNDDNHDTITMLAIDKFGNIAAGGSTNGLKHKIAGRVGDTPIPGAGAYADNEAGAASATGNGDIMMRFLPSFLAVEQMRNGMSPTDAASFAIKRIASHYPGFFGAVIAINVYGEYGAACNGMDSFPFCVANPLLGKVQNFTISCK